MKNIIAMTIALLSITAPVVNGQDIQTMIDSLHRELKKTTADSSKSLIMAELGYRYYLKPETALKFSKLGLALAQKIGYNRGIAANQTSLGCYYGAVGDHILAYNFLLKALEGVQLYGTSEELARCYLILGVSSYVTAGDEDAKKYTRKSLALYEKAGSVDIPLALNNLGWIYGINGSYDSALYCLTRGLAIAKKNKSYEFESNLLNSLAELYLTMKVYPKAEYFIKQAIERNKNLETRIQSINYLMLSRLYKETGQLAKAIANAHISLQTAKEVAEQSQIVQAARMLHELYLLKQDYPGAIRYLKESTQAHDSLYSIEKAKEIQRLKVSFELKEKEAEIKILQQQSSLQQVQMQLQNDNMKKQQFLLAGLIIVLIFLAITLTRYRAVTRIRRELEIERVRNHIAQDLHDDIGSTLSSIRIISKIGSQNGDQANVISNFSLIESHSSKMLSTMADIVWSINPNNDTMEKVIVHMKEFAAEILEPNGINYQFVQSGKMENLKLDVTIRKNLFLIFKEAINNAVKYSGCTEIEIRMTFHSGKLMLTIKDNGSGFAFNNVKLGNGLNNMKERATLINANFEILTSEGAGTHISVFTSIT